MIEVDMRSESAEMHFKNHIVPMFLSEGFYQHLSINRPQFFCANSLPHS